MICCIKWRWKFLLPVLLALWPCVVTAFTPPLSQCYALDKSNYLHDFTDWIGKEFEYDGKGSDFVLRFCKDVQNRSNSGYVDYGRFAPHYTFISGSGDADFVQEYSYGDLRHCEYNGYDQMGRDAQVRIVCGKCSEGNTCQDDFGCICNVSYIPTICRTEVVIAINCVPRGPRVLPGFTVGFDPRGRDVVNNGIVQWGFYKPFHDYSFGTDQTSVALYFTAIAALSRNIGKPGSQVYPGKGLSIKLSGTAAGGLAPTTESPTVLQVDWQCEIARENPYEVTITVPVEGYNPIMFYLCKICENKQKARSSGSRGWATFGILSCIAIVLATAFCCAGFCYKTRVEHKHGLEALPGVGILTSCLEMASGGGSGYSPADEASNIMARRTWDKTSVSSRVPQRAVDSKYGTV